jgi:hypothetical protein
VTAVLTAQESLHHSVKQLHDTGFEQTLKEFRGAQPVSNSTLNGAAYRASQPAAQPGTNGSEMTFRAKPHFVRLSHFRGRQPLWMFQYQGSSFVGANKHYGLALPQKSEIIPGNSQYRER